jgi:GH25 family lysozyme M1 (1,4-beta-N-acetylmuramidase)
VLATPTIAGTGGASAAGAIDGPDVSSYQHPYGAPIRWAAVKRAGKEFAIVKATEGTSYVNPWFRTDYWRVHKVGMVRGSYHFARPAYPIVQTATTQAKFYVRRLGTSPRSSRTLPPALDLEMTGGLTPGPLVTWAQTFLLTVRRLTGRTPMLYTYPSFWTDSLGDRAALARYPRWMASYSSGVDGATTLWQYTSGARVKGIRGSVDMSRLTAPSASWRALSDGRNRTSWPAQAPGAPQEVWATAAAGRATVHWMPGDTGSSLVGSYVVTASPGGASTVVDGLQLGATVKGLRNGTAYRFTVRAVNSVGTGAASAATGAVTPMVPTRLVLHAPTSVVYGKGAGVGVVLTRTDNGAGVAGRTVALRTRPIGTTTWSKPVSLVTDGAGRARTTLHPTVGLELRADFTGATGYVSRRVQSVVRVSTAVRAALSAPEIPLGQSATLTGSIGPATPGIRVTRQILRHGKWESVDSAKTDATGAVSFTFTPLAAGVKTYRLVVPAFGGRTKSYAGPVTLTIT